MDSSSTQQSSASPRRLAELLDEQQEPFVLEIYLLERGYRIRRSLELEGEIIGCCSSTKHKNSNKFLKKSSSYHAGAIPATNYKPAQFSSTLRTFLTKLVSRKRRRTPTEKQEVHVSGGGGRCSSVCCSTALSSNTWSDSETDEESISIPSPVTNDVSYDKSAPKRLMTTQWRFFEENKQCSPDSVLQEIDLLQSIPVYNNVRKLYDNSPSETKIRFQKKVSEDAILSASLWELLMKLRTKKPKRKRGRKPFPDYMNSKKALQKNRQLLLDCVREAVENANQQKSSSSKGLIMGPEEIGKVICKNLKSWGKLCSDVRNIKKLLRMDLLGGAINDEWGGFEAWKREIVGEIGNGIVDEIIEETIREISIINQY